MSKLASISIKLLLCGVLLLSPACTRSLDSSGRAQSSSLTLAAAKPHTQTQSFPTAGELIRGEKQAPSGAAVKQEMETQGRRWFYGQGIGRTAANVTTSILFPPYLIYLLGNAGLTLAGYQPVYVTNLIPEQPRKHVVGALDAVTSVPGRINAYIAGEEFQDSTPKTEALASNAKARDN